MHSQSSSSKSLKIKRTATTKSTPSQLLQSSSRPSRPSRLSSPIKSIKRTIKTTTTPKMPTPPTKTTRTAIKPFKTTINTTSTNNITTFTNNNITTFTNKNNPRFPTFPFTSSSPHLSLHNITKRNQHDIINSSSFKASIKDTSGAINTHNIAHIALNQQHLKQQFELEQSIALKEHEFELEQTQKQFELQRTQKQFQLEQKQFELEQTQKQFEFEQTIALKKLQFESKSARKLLTFQQQQEQGQEQLQIEHQQQQQFLLSYHDNNTTTSTSTTNTLPALSLLDLPLDSNNITIQNKAASVDLDNNNDKSANLSPTSKISTIPKVASSIGSSEEGFGTKIEDQLEKQTEISSSQPLQAEEQPAQQQQQQQQDLLLHQPKSLLKKQLKANNASFPSDKLTYPEVRYRLTTLNKSTIWGYYHTRTWFDIFNDSIDFPYFFKSESKAGLLPHKDSGHKIYLSSAHVSDGEWVQIRGEGVDTSIINPKTISLCHFLDYTKAHPNTKGICDDDVFKGESRNFNYTIDIKWE